MPKLKLSKKSKSPDTRPARVRYWNSKHLEKNKVKALMNNTGLTRQQAQGYWEAVRGNRRTPILIQKTPLSSIEQKNLYKKIVA